MNDETQGQSNASDVFQAFIEKEEGLAAVVSAVRSKLAADAKRERKCLARLRQAARTR